MEEVQPDRAGQTMGDRYRITATLGGGAMASVYRGLDLRHNTEVAIKILKDEIKDRSSYRDRFEREVLITSKVNHPRCIHKLDFGLSDEGVPYQVMELVPGRSLADLLDAVEHLPPPRALKILEQLLHALAACSDQGIIHRDVKPENILIYDKDGETDCLKLIDFGIAKLIGEAAEGHEKLTSVGTILGTPHYIAPEWVTSDNVDPRADLYSATVLLFEMLTSTPPFLSEDRRELMKKHLREKPPKLKDRAPHLKFSNGLEAMVKRGLQKDPKARFKDAREYLDVLREVAGNGVASGTITPALAQAPILDPALDPSLPLDPSLAPMAAPSQPLPPSGPYVPVPAAGGQVSPSGAHVPVSPSGAYAPAAMDPHTPVLALHRPQSVGMQGRKRNLSPLLIGGAVGLAGCLLVTLAMLDGGDSKAGAGTGQAADAGVEAAAPSLDAAVIVADAAPPEVVVVPMSDEQLEPALAAFREADLEPTDFAGTMDDARANGACRFGTIADIRALLCVAEFDPAKSRKAVRRKLPGESKSRKWRARIKRGDIQLRVEDVRKKQKRTRRKIESAFKKLPK